MSVDGQIPRRSSSFESNATTMVKNFTGRQSSFTPFRRPKPGIGPASRATVHGRTSANPYMTQFAFGACSSGTLVHFSDPT